MRIWLGPCDGRPRAAGRPGKEELARALHSRSFVPAAHRGDGPVPRERGSGPPEHRRGAVRRGAQALVSSPRAKSAETGGLIGTEARNEIRQKLERRM